MTIFDIIIPVASAAFIIITIGGMFYIEKPHTTRDEERRRQHILEGLPPLSNGRRGTHDGRR